MTSKTAGAQLLVRDVLSAEFSEPYGEDIIRDVWFAIEANRAWRQRYESLEDELTKDVVNNWVPKYVKQAAGLKSLRRLLIKEGHIVTSYTKLGVER